MSDRKQEQKEEEDRVVIIVSLVSINTNDLWSLHPLCSHLVCAVLPCWLGQKEIECCNPGVSIVQL